MAMIAHLMVMMHTCNGRERWQHLSHGHCTPENGGLVACRTSALRDKHVNSINGSYATLCRMPFASCLLSMAAAVVL